MSHHLESPSSRADGRVDITDMYIFPGERSNTTTFIMNVNPDAGLSSPKTFRSDALYELKIDNDGDAIENMGLRLRFGEPDLDGLQTLELFSTRYAGESLKATERSLASGRTNEIIEIANGGRLWAGLAGDPFFADAHALDVFQAFIFGVGRNVSSIAIELPNTEFGTETLGVWATTYIWKNGKQIQINRYGKPLIHVL
jgi:hypothetical protein